MISLNDKIEFQGELWTRRELFEEAFRLLDKIDASLATLTERHEARILERALNCAEII